MLTLVAGADKGLENLVKGVGESKLYTYSQGQREKERTGGLRPPTELLLQQSIPQQLHSKSLAFKPGTSRGDSTSKHTSSQECGQAQEMVPLVT